MIETCGYCKDTHGRHQLGCLYLTEAEKINTWRQQHGYPKMERPDGFSSKLHWDCTLCGHYHLLTTRSCPEFPMRADGVLQADRSVKEGDILRVGPGAATAEILENPKDIAGSKKTPLHLLPYGALDNMAWVMKSGADKYGAWNWRAIAIKKWEYVAAILRHTFAISTGEWLDKESGRPHAAHIMATAAILMDAEQHGKLINAPE